MTMLSDNHSAASGAIHLETIYEESASSLSSSIVDANHQSSARQQLSPFYRANYTTRGLISARSIPSVDVHRRRQRRRPAFESPEKPPIEVRFRDGSSRFIQPASGSQIRRKQLYSSRYDLSSTSKMNNKYRQIFNNLSKKKRQLPKRPELLLTVITAADLRQAGVTPPLTSSPDESETVTLSKSLSNSSLDTIRTVNDSSLKDTNEVHAEPSRSLPRREPHEQNRIVVGESVPLNNGSFPSAYQTRPILNQPVGNPHFPFAPPPHSQQQQKQQQLFQFPQQIPSIRSRSLPPPARSVNLPPAQHRPIYNQMPPVAVVPPNQKRSVPSIQITLTNDENDRQRALLIHPPQSTGTSAPANSLQESRNTQQKSSFHSSANLLLGGGSRSAFRPFLKQPPVNAIPSQFTMASNIRGPLTMNSSAPNFSQRTRMPSFRPPALQQQQPINLSTFSRFPLHPSATVISRSEPRSISLDLPKIHMSDKSINMLPPKRTQPVHEQNPPGLKSANYNLPHQSFSNSSSVDFREQQNTENIPSIIEPHLQWHSVTSKSLYDVPRLSNRYADIPLRITIPVLTPTHNQRLVVKHDTALEQRLFAAGLSPETIALYERILEVANNLPTSSVSPPEIIGPYSRQPLL